MDYFVGNEALKKAKLKAVLDAAFRDGGRSSRDRKDQDSKEVASVESDDGSYFVISSFMYVNRNNI